MFNFNKKIDDFSISMANNFISSFTLEQSMASPNKNKFQKHLNKVMKNMDSEIRDFKSSTKIGVYKKARIGNKFMWVLKEHKYDEQLIEEITKQLLLKLN